MIAQLGAGGGRVLRAFTGPGSKRLLPGTTITAGDALAMPVKNRQALAAGTAPYVEWQAAPAKGRGKPPVQDTLLKEGADA